MAKVTEYITEDGKNPFSRWFSSLGTSAALKVRTATAQMEAGNFGDHKSVGGGVWERRINFEKGYRIYYAKDGDEFVLLLCGGTKSRQQSDIDKAKGYWSEYKKRKKQELKGKQEKEQKEQEESKTKPRKQNKRRRN